MFIMVTNYSDKIYLTLYTITEPRLYCTSYS